jgi:heat shock protein HslJ
VRRAALAASLSVEGAEITIPDGGSITIAFEGGRATGTGGCNRFTGTYEQDGESLSLGRVASTRMACPEEVMGAETAYFSVLESVSSWSTARDELVLYDYSGEELLRYEAARG